MKLKINGRVALVFILFGIIITPYILRNKFFPDLIAGFNIIGMIGVLIMARKYYRKKNHQQRVLKLLIVIAAYFMLLWNSEDIVSIIKTTLSIFLPMIVLDFDCMDNKNFRRIFPVILRFFDYSVGFMCICGVVDIISEWKISGFFADYYGTESLQGLLEDQRLVSYMGHSLLTTEIVLIFYILHIINQFYITKKRKMVVPTIEAVFLIALTGSKTGLVLLGVLIIMVYGKWQMLKYIPILVVVLYLGYRFGLFEILSERLLIGLETGDITTGRLTSFKQLYESGILNFQWFTGHSSTLINQNTSMIAALENPIMRWAYRYGVFFALLMSIRLFIFPIKDMLRYKNIKLFLMAIVYIIDINTYDTVCSIGDSMLRYCIVIYILLNTMKYVEEEIQ